MAGVSFETIGTILADAAIELGLVTSLGDPYGSNDQNVVLLRQLAISVGRELVGKRDWSHLKKQTTVSLVNGTYVYALPNDFARYIDGSGWNRTTQLPLGGPVDSLEWQDFQARSVSGTYTLYVRIVNNELWFHPTPSSAQTAAYEYISSYWVKPSGQSAPTTDRPTANTDTIHFEPLLFLRALKLKWLRQKGLDTSAAQDDFDERYQQVASQDGAAPALRLAGGSSGLRDPIVPDTGFGS